MSLAVLLTEVVTEGVFFLAADFVTPIPAAEARILRTFLSTADAVDSPPDKPSTYWAFKKW